MKKTYLWTLLLVLALATASCSGTNSQSGQSNATDPARNQGTNNNRPISPQLQLAVGTLKLEGTSHAVNAKEAAQLLPLWQLFSQLETSSSSAPQEVSAVVDQIKSTMASDQIDAITAMNLTNRDAFTFLQQQGIMQAGGFSFNGTPQANRTPRAGGGGFPGGGFPGGGFAGGVGNGQNLNPSQLATVQARRSQGGGFGNRLPPGVVDAVVKLLQSKLTPGLTSTPPVTSTKTPAQLFTGTPTPTP